MQRPINMTQSRSQPKMLVQNERVEFHKYNQNYESSPMRSSEYNISPNIYPNRKTKIRNLKASIQSNQHNPELQYDNYFYLRNSPVTNPSNKKLPFMIKPKAEIEMPKSSFSHTEPELSQHFKSGVNSMYSSNSKYAAPRNKYNY
jgi:cytochrome c biogenesis protein ResB